MKFFCYGIYSGDPAVSEPVGFCAIGEKVYIPIKAKDMYNLTEDIRLFDKTPEILEGCGWVLFGEENKLANIDYIDILRFGIEQKAKKDAQEKK